MGILAEWSILRRTTLDVEISNSLVIAEHGKVGSASELPHDLLPEDGFTLP